MSIAGTLQDSVNIRYVFTISGTPTTVSGADDNSRTLAYTEGQADVYLNGVKQVVGTDVTATSGNSVVFASALAANDVVEVVAFDTFQAANIDAGAITSGTLNTARIADDSITNDKLDNPGRRNLIINGDMKIAQRATSVTGKTASGYYTVDRWRNTISGLGTWSFSQSTDTPTGQGFGYSLKLDCTTADASPATGDYFILTQLLEGQDLQRLKKGTSNAESVTVSFWVKSTKTGTYVLEFEDADNTRSISQSYTVDSASTWEKKTLTFAGDTTGAFTNDNNTSLAVNFWYGAGTDYTSGSLNTSWGTRTAANIAPGLTNLGDNTANELYITGVQLELGNTASDFEHKPFGEELVLCQRYFQKSYAQGTPVGNASSANRYYYLIGGNTDTTNKGGSYTLQTQMRALPTMTFYNDSGTSGTMHTPSGATINVILLSTHHFTFYINMAGREIFGHHTAEAELT